MKKIEINKKTIIERFGMVENSLGKLENLKKLTSGEFVLNENFAVAEHYLRYALQATFDICSHILSRIPGIKTDRYAEMAVEMGRQEIIPMDFAENELKKMAKYRNRLTHFYFEVTPGEMYDIIQNHLGDFEIFLTHIKKLLANGKE